MTTKLDSILKNVKESIEVVSGACSTGAMTYNRPDGTSVCGADGLAERYAADRGLPIVWFPADWTTHGNSAGAIRNKAMAEYATHCVCFWDGESAGTKMMIDIATEKKLILRVVTYENTKKKK